MSRIRPAVRCRARRTNGEPCANYAMMGATVCHAHGGRAPQVRAAAQRRQVVGAIYATFAKHMAEQKTEREALAPYAEPRYTATLDRCEPRPAARRLVLEARALEAEARRRRDRAVELVALAGERRRR